jgi:hypothetical protein
MSASAGASARRHPPGDRRLATLAALPIVFAVIAVGVASADVPSGAVRLSADDAQRSGSAIRLTRQPLAGSTLIRIQPPQTASSPSLLAVSPDGALAALADRVGELSGSLTVASVDGSQLQLQLPGLIGAAFAGDASWIAVIDGRGALWRVHVDSGRAELMADGAFLGSPLVAADGSLLLLSVPSVEAPYRSRLVRFDPATGTSDELSDEELVYGAFPLEGGDLAVVAHRPEGSIVQRLTTAGARVMAKLDPGAINVAVAANGRIAFERDGEGVLLVDAPGSAPRPIGIGSRPCFAPDGSSLLIRRGNQSVALGLDGSVLAVIDELAAFAGAAGCGS